MLFLKKTLKKVNDIENCTITSYQNIKQERFRSSVASINPTYKDIIYYISYFLLILFVLLFMAGDFIIDDCVYKTEFYYKFIKKYSFYIKFYIETTLNIYV